jgi:hypothetical protein
MKSSCTPKYPYNKELLATKALCIPLFFSFADIEFMKILPFILLPFYLFAAGPFDAPKPQKFDLSAFETKRLEIHEITSENEKIKCRWVCDKKIYKEKEIGDAVSFYKNAKEYKFKE